MKGAWETQRKTRGSRIPSKGIGEQGATELQELGANKGSAQGSELPPTPQAREQEVPRKELKQATITMFMPEAPPEAPPPPLLSELQNV